MTSEKDQIQTLIAEIDTLLSKANPRFPLVRLNDADQQRQILAKTQRYLIALQQSMQAPGGWGPIDPETGAFYSGGGAQTRPESASTESAQQVLQAVLQEMQYLRTNLLQPLRLEIDTLNQERQSLQQEVRQLEIQRLQAEAGQSQTEPAHLLSEEVLQIFMQRLQSSLSEQIAQALTKLKHDAANNFLLEEFLEAEVVAADQPRLHPSQRLDQLRTIQAQSDQLLLKLDSTLKVVFETLQNNIHSYQNSLSQGLSKMHGLGQQGEAIVTALITHLAQQLGRETSLHRNVGLDIGLDSGGLPGETASQNRLLNFQENAELEELEEALPISKSWETPSAGLEGGELDLDLEDLDLDTDLDVDEAIKRLQVDPDIPLLQLNEIEDEDITAGQDNQEPTLIQPQPELVADSSEPVETADLLELLNQFRQSPQVGDAANLEVSPDASSEADISPDLKELDQFYESLFGANSVTSAAEVSEADTEAMTSLKQEDESPPEPDRQPDRQVESLTEAESANFTLDDFLYQEGSDSGVSGTQETADIPTAKSVGASDPEASPEASIDAFFGEELTQAVLNLGPDTTPDTISSLNELLPREHEGTAVRGGQPHDRPASPNRIDTLDISLSEDLSDTDWDNDTYVPAPPEEELLVIEQPEPDSGLNLDLVNPALQQLMNEELSSLEGLEPTEPSELELEFQTAETDLEPDGEDSQQSLLASIVHELGIPDVLPDSEVEGDSGLTLEKLIEAEAQQSDELSLSPADAAEITQEVLEDLSLADLLPEVDRPSSLVSSILEAQNLESEDLEAVESLRLERRGEDAGFSEADSTTFEELEEGLVLSDQDLEDQGLGDEDIEIIESGLSLQNVLEEVENSAQPTALLGVDEITLESLEALNLEDLMPTTEAELALENEFIPDLDIQPGLEVSNLAHPNSPLDEPVTDEALNLPDLNNPSEEARELTADDLIPDDLAEALIVAPEGETQSSAAQLESALVPDLPDLDERPELDADQQSQLAHDQTLETNIASEITDEEIIDLPPLAETEADIQPQEWFLGIDFGSTGLSAVLMNRDEGDAYPIYWTSGHHQDPEVFTEKLFRLPAIAYLAPTNAPDDRGTTSQPPMLQVAAVGPSALQLTLERNARVADEDVASSGDLGLLLRSLKSLLKVGIPVDPANQEAWGPTIQWSDTQQVLLNLAHDSLQAIFQTFWAIDHPSNPAKSNSSLVCGAIGLDSYQFKQALDQLQGVIIGYPANWPDTYSFNIREAILAAQLVIHPEQVFFVEDAIAAVLSGLRDPMTQASGQTPQSPHQQSLYNCDWQGGAVVISAGASLTELALVNIPQTLQDLTYTDFSLRSFPYAGEAIDQDIICQLLYPHTYHQSPPGENSTTSTPSASDADEGWGWQVDLPESAPADWRSLGLESLELPRSGEPELVNRRRLQQRLEDSVLGQSLLEAARHLKLILQHQFQFQLELGGQQWVIRREVLESRIFFPYIQRVNRQLNVLLSQTGVSPQAINQVICTGGSASLSGLARLLRQKFPNATIIQDTYPSDRPASCSRITYGLANLARYPQVLDVVRQQYSDYFLLLELLRNFPEQPLPLSGVMHLLEERGINTKACYTHILALLEGHLPPGLLPTEQDLPLISERSLEMENYQVLGSAPLFTKQGGQIYVPNPAQRRHLSEHLEALMANKLQTLEEPLIAQLVQPVSPAS